MDQPRTYPFGVPCWVDTEQPDPDAASRFYAGLFGWTLVDAVPAGVPGSYLVASLDGRDLAAVGPDEGRGHRPPVWNTYIAVTDTDATAAAVTAAGGTVVAEPWEAGPGGRAAVCADPAGAEFRLWQPRRRPGAQLVNAPGAWNFSNLHTDDRDALAFYVTVFGWVAEDMGPAGTMIRVPGYGDHLAATVDPGIRERQRRVNAPPGFADVIARTAPASGGRPHWHVSFTVADRDASAAAAGDLGGTVLSTKETGWTREALVRDPQGAEFTVSQFAPPA